MKVLLFGVSCVGKTTTGKILAEKLGYHFIDLDLEIKKQYQTNLDGFMEMFPYPHERGKEKGKLLLNLVLSNDDVVIAVSPIYYSRFFNRLFLHKGVLPVELYDTKENLFERMVFSDENDVEYKDEAYKTRHKSHYLKEYSKELTSNKKLFEKIKFKYFVDNKSQEKVADDLYKIIQKEYLNN